MKPFAYAAPSSVDEAVGLLAAAAGRARPLAGGTDLIAQLSERRLTLDLVVDVKGIPELTEIGVDDDGTTRIGAAAPLADVARHPAVAGRYPAVATACSLIGSVLIQNRGTLGGNIGNASPSADGIPPLIVHGAEAVVAGPGGRRTVPVERVCTGPGRTSLEPGEIIVQLVLPPPPPGTGSHYVRFIPRNEMDIAVAGAAVALTLDPETRLCRRARIALSAVAPTPIRAPEAEAFLEGRVLDGGPAGDGILREAARLAAAAARPISDVRGSAEYRRHLVEVLTRRALAAVVEGLLGAHGHQGRPAATGREEAL